MTITSQKLRADASQFRNSANADLLNRWADELDELQDDRDRLHKALSILVDNVREYEAWQRPCWALDQAILALEKQKAPRNVNSEGLASIGVTEQVQGTGD